MDLSDQYLDGFRDYMRSIDNTVIELNDGYKVKILEYDIKERNEQHILILRYQVQWD